MALLTGRASFQEFFVLRCKELLTLSYYSQPPWLAWIVVGWSRLAESTLIQILHDYMTALLIAALQAGYVVPYKCRTTMQHCCMSRTDIVAR